MAKRLQHVRLAPRDLEELTRCLDRLNQIHDSVNATGMAGKLAIMGLCVEIYRCIESVLRKEAELVQRFVGQVDPGATDASSQEGN